MPRVAATVEQVQESLASLVKEKLGDAKVEVNPVKITVKKVPAKKYRKVFGSKMVGYSNDETANISIESKGKKLLVSVGKNVIDYDTDTEGIDEAKEILQAMKKLHLRVQKDSKGDNTKPKKEKNDYVKELKKLLVDYIGVDGEVSINNTGNSPVAILTNPVMLNDMEIAICAKKDKLVISDNMSEKPRNVNPTGKLKKVHDILSKKVSKETPKKGKKPAKEENDEDDEEEKPSKKGKKPAKKESDEEEEKPSKKGKTPTQEESDDEEEKPAKKGKKPAKEESDEDDEEEKTVVKKIVEDSDSDEYEETKKEEESDSESDDDEPVKGKKNPGKTKAESDQSDEEDEPKKNEPEENDTSDTD